MSSQVFCCLMKTSKKEAEENSPESGSSSPAYDQGESRMKKRYDVASNKNEERKKPSYS